MTDSMAIPSARDCLGRTCLQWRDDGELEGLDRHLVMQRLARVAPEASVLVAHNMDVQICAGRG